MRWHRARRRSGPAPRADGCGPNCYAYEVVVTESAFRLRIGIDRPRLQDVWTAEVFRPNGTRAGSFSPGTELYSAELRVPTPAVGTYVVEVTADSVVDRRFRMRAALELATAACRMNASGATQPATPPALGLLLPAAADERLSRWASSN